MARLVAAVLIALGLAACGRDDPAPAARVSTASAPSEPVAVEPVPDTAEVSLSSRNIDTQALAKAAFSRVESGSTQAPAAYGFFTRGCLAGGIELAETGPTWQAMRLSRGRNWAHPETIDYVQDLSRKAARLDGWQGLYVGDMSQPRGGPMRSGHRSHQTGLDADIWLRPASVLGLSRADRERVGSISMQRANGAYVNDNWTPQHHDLLKAAASDPRVARIFIFAGAKVRMCRDAKGDRAWLRKIRPWWGHHYHFHVRLNCPEGVRGCEDQDPVPPGDGCDEAEAWVDRILNPPPPDPDAPKPEPRRELVLADLPRQCLDVLSSR